MCDFTSISSHSSLHKCWFAVAGVIVFVYGPVCFMCTAVTLRHRCRDEGNVEVLLMIFSWQVCAKAELPLGCLPPALLIIVPFHPMPRLNPWETSGPLSHTWLLWLYPPPTRRFCFALLFALQISLHTLRVCMCACTHNFFFFFFFF